MKFSTILLIGLVILLSIQAVNAEDSSTLYDNEHYLIVGHIYEPYNDDNQVILTNIRTGEQLEISAVDCEHGLKVYLFNLANLHRCWKNNDEIIITYNNNSTSIIIDNSMTGTQVDLNAPDDYTPIPVITGTILILASGGGYYYIKKKKNENNEIDEGNECNECNEDNEDNTKIKGDKINMNEKETESVTQETGFKLYRDFGVRAWIATLIIFGYITSVIGCVYTNNMDALKQLSIAILPIVTVIVMFYFQSSATRDMLEKLQK